jgi:hypothetical protein
MQYTIKRGISGSIVATVKPTGQQSKKIMGENIVTMSITLPRSVDFEINDYVDVFSDSIIERYFLLDLADVKKTSSIEFTYTITFKGWQYKLGDAALLMADANNQFTLSGQSIMGNLDVFMNLVITNANRDQTGWVKGNVDATDFQLITFGDNETCLSALATLAIAFNTEWWVNGQTINMSKQGVVEDITYEYGKGKGLYDITRTQSTDKQIFTRLYAYGSDRNIPADYKGHSNKLKLPGTTPYLEKNVWVNPADHSSGVKYGVIEYIQVFDDIYPHRVGTVTSLGADIFTFTDSAIDFDVNAQLLGQGTTAKVTFNTGLLAGYTFEMNSFNATTKEIKINLNQDDKAFVLPSAPYIPAIGDTYVITDIAMPASYITAAENKLADAAQALLDTNSSPIVTYGVTCDPVNFKARGIVLVLGNYVHVVDTDLHLDSNIRIVGFTRDLQIPSKYSMDLADVVSIAAIVKSYQQYAAVKSGVNLNKLNDINRTRMNWKTTQELRNMVYDPDGYFDGTNIRPNSIETLMLSVGAKSQQFILSGITFEPNYTGDANKFLSTNGELIQFSLFPSPFTWTVTGITESSLDPAKSYYIYAKCSKTTDLGEILLSETPVTSEGVAGYYMFWIGALHSVIDGVRGISLTYGQTTVNGRFITTGRIQSADGGTYFDLDEGLISGRIVFGNNGTSTVVDGNLVTSGTIVLGNVVDTQNSGMTGEGTDPTSVRFWAGDTYANRADAPFRVLDDGSVVMSDAVIKGDITAKTGTIGNFTIDANGLTNSSGNDAYIIQEKLISGGYKQGARIGTNIDATGYMGYFYNDVLGSGPNYGVYISVTNGDGGGPLRNGLTGNMALETRGDIYITDGNLIIEDDIYIDQLEETTTLAGHGTVVRNNTTGKLKVFYS